MKINKDLVVENTNLSTIENNCVYSTEEKVIGIWIDGKPIYRKVVSTTIANLGTTLNSIGIDTIIDFFGMAYSTYDQWWMIPNNYSSTDYNIYFFQSANKTISISFGTYYNTSRTAYVVIEYTKTTD